MKCELSDLTDMINTVKNMRKRLENLNNELDNVANYATNAMNYRFSTSLYSGYNDVVCVKNGINNGFQISATGNAVMFIEFGTGISYPDSHPMANELNIKHGTYGKKKGNYPSWYYYGTGGKTGEYVKTTEKGDLYKTSGNPANMPVYLTSLAVQQKLKELKGDIKFDKH